MDTLLWILRQTPKPDWRWTLNNSGGCNESGSWSKDNALSLANCALLSYRDEPFIREQLTARGFATVNMFRSPNPGTDTQAFVAVNDDLAVVAFRGTEPTNPTDFLTDFNTDRVDFSDVFGYQGWGKLWGGWAQGVVAVLPGLLNALKDKPDRPLWITGHSLGGALAVTFAAALAGLPKHPIKGVYTYGQPRVGDPVFCEQYNQALGNCTFRHVNDRDLVPHVPPRRFTRVEQQIYNPSDWLHIGHFADAVQHWNEVCEYGHVGQLRLLLPNGGYTDDLAQEESREPAYFNDNRANPLAMIDLDKLSIEAGLLIKDHAPINPFTHDGYIERIENL